MKRRRALAWIVALLLIFIGLPVWLVQRQIRQERLDTDLIFALQAGNPDKALALIRQGASPNAHRRALHSVSF
jgi:hypothetical protein